MAFFFSKRKVRPGDGEAAGELNIVPYLDILMNLILFILLSITGLATFGVVRATAPGSAPGPAPAAPPLLLTVAVSARGFYVAAAEGVVAEGRAPTVALRADGSPDFGGLTQKLVEVKRAFPAETKVVVAAEPGISYEVLVGTMDAVREGPERAVLFPDITLGTF